MDLYSLPGDSKIEVGHMARAELRVISLVQEHYAGGRPETNDFAFLDHNLNELLAS